jgi:hypothetical protein
MDRAALQGIALGGLIVSGAVGGVEIQQPPQLGYVSLGVRHGQSPKNRPMSMSAAPIKIGTAPGW